MKAIVLMVFCCLFALGGCLVVADALDTGSVRLGRGGAVHRWVEEPVMFTIGVAAFVLFAAFFLLGGFGAWRNISWRDWRH